MFENLPSEFNSITGVSQHHKNKKSVKILTKLVFIYHSNTSQQHVIVMDHFRISQDVLVVIVQCNTFCIQLCIQNVST